MIKISSLAAMVVVTGVLGCGAVLAQASEGPAGKWTYKLGATGTPCSVTLTAGGSDDSGDIATEDSCPGGLARLGHWQSRGANLELSSPSGSLVAVLHRTETGYTGKQIGGGRRISLSR